MTKSVKICIAVIVLIFISALILSLVLLQKKDNEYISIVQDNKVLYTLNLNTTENKTIRIEDNNGGYNIIEILDGKIRISYADCPDKTCVNMGFLSSNMPIVCLPHKLVIKYNDEY
ncbi:MAG: NusG domain II-containing protein [Ruminococcus sp.]|nr:NusG domain II-containing protein [Ruminococcus sp.]MDE7098988.1 NusG domain II-containing protein [Ruminococcus sp.]